ncbi:Ras-related protein Rac [Acrasis kona]|uniref:Ras-related protein Rac n=1 Tax=Acrasis kona TaxID=1008807 RepID=A0AAW2ZH86_9EUKA
MTTIKCVVVGDGAVGKTCLIISFSNNTFPEQYIPTVSDNFYTNTQYEGESVLLGIWDTAGQEDFDRLRPMSYPDTQVFIACFSVTFPNSLESVKTKWASELRHYCPDVPIVLAGTKLDMKDDKEVLKQLSQLNQHPVTDEEGQKMANQIGAVKYVPCSAKTQENLKLLFQTAIASVLRPNNSGGKKKKACMIL